MSDVADLIVAGARRRCDAGYGPAAGLMRDHLRRILGVQAPLVPGVTPPTAATRATPGAIPRRVSGYLQDHADADQVEPGKWVFGIREGPWYAAALEYEMNHPFFNPMMEAAVADIVTTVADGMRGESQ